MNFRCYVKDKVVGVVYAPNVVTELQRAAELYGANVQVEEA